MTMITPSYLGETIEYSSLHACRSTLEDPTRISQGVHAYLKEKGIPHVWHVDGHAHDATEWRNNLYYFAQKLFR